MHFCTPGCTAQGALLGQPKLREMWTPSIHRGWGAGKATEHLHARQWARETVSRRRRYWQGQVGRDKALGGAELQQSTPATSTEKELAPRFRSSTEEGTCPCAEPGECSCRRASSGISSSLLSSVCHRANSEQQAWLVNAPFPPGAEVTGPVVGWKLG